MQKTGFWEALEPAYIILPTLQTSDTVRLVRHICFLVTLRTLV